MLVVELVALNLNTVFEQSGSDAPNNAPAPLPRPTVPAETGSGGTSAQKCPRVYPSAIGDLVQNDLSHNSGK